MRDRALLDPTLGRDAVQLSEELLDLCSIDMSNPSGTPGFYALLFPSYRPRRVRRYKDDDCCGPSLINKFLPINQNLNLLISL